MIAHATIAGAPPGQRLLIVDDDEAVVRSTDRLLRRRGFAEIRTLTDPRRVLSVFNEFGPDLVLLDLRMPGLDGFAVIRQITARVPHGEYLPILVTSGDPSPEARKRALALGAADFIGKPFGLEELTLRITHLLRTRALTVDVEGKIRARTATLKRSEIEVAMRLAATAELRDYLDAAHVQRVGKAAAMIAARLGIDSEIVSLIRHAAPLHDIGKIGIPDAILLKPGPLSLDEWDVMKSHTTLGAQLLSGSRSPILQMAEEIALYHHECWDGTGYTPGLRGEDIPLVARIVAVADVCDALTHRRPYKRAWSEQESLDWMCQMRGTRFDPAVLDCLVDIVTSNDPEWRAPVDEPWLLMHGSSH